MNIVLFSPICEYYKYLTFGSFEEKSGWVEKNVRLKTVMELEIYIFFRYTLYEWNDLIFHDSSSLKELILFEKDRGPSLPFNPVSFRFLDYSMPLIVKIRGFAIILVNKRRTLER